MPAPKKRKTTSAKSQMSLKNEETTRNNGTSKKYKPTKEEEDDDVDMEEEEERYLDEALCQKQTKPLSEKPNALLSNDLMHKVFTETNAAPFDKENAKTPMVIASSSSTVLPLPPLQTTKTVSFATKPKIHAKSPKQEPPPTLNTTVPEQKQQQEDPQTDLSQQFKKQWYRSGALMGGFLVLGMVLIVLSLVLTPPSRRSEPNISTVDPQNIVCRVLPSGRQECFDTSSGTPVAIPATRDEEAQQQQQDGSNLEQPTVEEEADATFISEAVEEPYPDADTTVVTDTRPDDATARSVAYGDAAYAASSGDMEQVESFLESMPELVHTMDSNGWTLLHEAARMGHTRLVEYLVHSRGAVVDARTTQGQTALDIALYKLMDESHPTIVLLKQIMGMIPLNSDSTEHSDPSEVTDGSVNPVDASDTDKDVNPLDAELLTDAIPLDDPVETLESKDDAASLDSSTDAVPEPPVDATSVAEPVIINPEEENIETAIVEEPQVKEPGEVNDLPTDAEPEEEEDGDENEEEYSEDEEEVEEDEAMEGDEEEEELPLGYAQELIANGDVDALRSVLDAHPDLVYEVDPTTGHSLLHVAAQLDHSTDCIQVLLDYGVDLWYSIEESDGTALDVAMAAHPDNLQHPNIVMLQEAMGLGKIFGSLDEVVEDNVEASPLQEDAESNERASREVDIEIPSLSSDELLAEALREFDAMQQQQ